MKKILIISLILIFSFSLVSAQSENSSGRQGVVSQEEEENQNQNQNQEGNLISAPGTGNATAVREMIQERKQEMEQALEGLENEVEQSVYQNQNRVRLAVHSLLAIEDLVGGIGSQVSEIAQEFDNSVQATIKAEEKVKKRDGILKFFMGSDQEALQTMEEELNQNRTRIQELKELRSDCDCQEEVKNIFQEQVQNMEAEQNRLRQLVEEENKIKGVWGWVKSLFGR
jgi:hypothetical protein